MSRRFTIGGTNQRYRLVDDLDERLGAFERMYRRGLVKSCILVALIVALLVFGRCF